MREKRRDRVGRDEEKEKETDKDRDRPKGCR
jgi:hypothetical protein